MAKGIFDSAAAPDTSIADRAALQARRDYLARQLAQALSNLAALHTNLTYQQVSIISDLGHHFKELYAELTQELARWKQLVLADEPATY